MIRYVNLYTDGGTGHLWATREEADRSSGYRLGRNGLMRRVALIKVTTKW